MAKKYTPIKSDVKKLKKYLAKNGSDTKPNKGNIRGDRGKA